MSNLAYKSSYTFSFTFATFSFLLHQVAHFHHQGDASPCSGFPVHRMLFSSLAKCRCHILICEEHKAAQTRSIYNVFCMTLAIHMWELIMCIVITVSHKKKKKHAIPLAQLIRAVQDLFYIPFTPGIDLVSWSADACQRLPSSQQSTRCITPRLTPRGTRRTEFPSLYNNKKSILGGNDKVYMIATPVSYSSNEHHSAEQRRWKNNNVAGLQIVFADSSTARMAVDGYYFSTLFARPPCETPLFLNECLRNSPLKLVQCGAIHHAERCRWGTAVSSSVSHMGLPGRCGAPDLVVERSAAGHVAPPLLFYSDWSLGAATSFRHRQQIFATNFCPGGQGTFLQRCIIHRETGTWGLLRTARTVRSRCSSCFPQFFRTGVSVCAIYLQREQNRTAANLKLTVGSFP